MTETETKPQDQALQPEPQPQEQDFFDTMGIPAPTPAAAPPAEGEPGVELDPFTHEAVDLMESPEFQAPEKKAEPVTPTTPIAPGVVEAAPIVTPTPKTPTGVEAEWEIEKAALQKEIGRLSTHIQDTSSGTIVPPAQTPAAPVGEAQRFTPPDELVTEEEWQGAYGSREGLDVVAKKIYGRAVQDVLTMLPKTVAVQIQHQTAVKTLVDDFYEKSPDLIPHGQYIAFLTNEISAANPGKTLPDILPVVETEARRRIGISKMVKGAPAVPGQVPSPALPGGKTSVRVPITTKVPTKQQDIMQDMMSD